jgi:hypothetical protein
MHLCHSKMFSTFQDLNLTLKFYNYQQPNFDFITLQIRSQISNNNWKTMSPRWLLALPLPYVSIAFYASQTSLKPSKRTWNTIIMKTIRDFFSKLISYAFLQLVNRQNNCQLNANACLKCSMAWHRFVVAALAVEWHFNEHRTRDPEMPFWRWNEINRLSHACNFCDRKNQRCNDAKCATKNRDKIVRCDDSFMDVCLLIWSSASVCDHRVAGRFNCLQFFMQLIYSHVSLRSSALAL